MIRSKTPGRVQVRRRGPKTRLIAKCDKLFSEWIRARDIGCQGRFASTCRGRAEQCAHFIARRYKHVRWDARNAVGLCGPCHAWATMRPLEWGQWWTLRLGPEQTEALTQQALSRDKVDVEVVWEMLKGWEKSAAGYVE